MLVEEQGRFMWWVSAAGKFFLTTGFHVSLVWCSNHFLQQAIALALTLAELVHVSGPAAMEWMVCCL